MQSPDPTVKMDKK